MSKYVIGTKKSVANLNSVGEIVTAFVTGGEGIA